MEKIKLKASPQSSPKAGDGHGTLFLNPTSEKILIKFRNVFRHRLITLGKVLPMVDEALAISGGCGIFIGYFADLLLSDLKVGSLLRSL